MEKIMWAAIMIMALAFGCAGDDDDDDGKEDGAHDYTDCEGFVEETYMLNCTSGLEDSNHGIYYRRFCSDEMINEPIFDCWDELKDAIINNTYDVGDPCFDFSQCARLD